MKRIAFFALLCLSAAALGTAAPARPTRPAVPGKRPTAAPASAAARQVRAPIDVPRLLAQHRVSVRTSGRADRPLDAGWDGNRFTSVELPIGPEGFAFFELTLDRPRAIDEFNLLCDPQTPARWSLAAADTPAHLTGHKGSYHLLVPPRPSLPVGDQATFSAPGAYRCYRCELRPAGGGPTVRLDECSLWTPQTLRFLTADAFSTDAAVGEPLPVTAEAGYDAGGRENASLDVSWEISPAGAGSVDALGRFVASRPGTAELVALLGSVRSAPLRIEVAEKGLPDWDVTYIERQPRVPHDGIEAPPTPGQVVSWFAHVRNYGTCAAQPVPVQWRVDGEVVRSGRLPRLERFGLTELILTTHADAVRHRIELVIDPDGRAPEITKANDRLMVLSDARPAGFWVEDSTIRYFHRHQRELGVGSNSWEDWAQRQVAGWNDWLDHSAWLWRSPEDARERWRLDRITQVGDRMLPMAGGSPHDEPDRRDRTIDIACGFPAADLPPGRLYCRTAEARPENPFFRQADLMRALARAPRRREHPRTSSGSSTTSPDPPT